MEPIDGASFNAAEAGESPAKHARSHRFCSYAISALRSRSIRQLNRGTFGICLSLVLSVIVSFPLSLGADGPPTLVAQAKAALAVTSGHVKVAGLRGPVRVLRDRWGLAHISALNQHDLFFAQGFVAAQDRLFQMELWKRSGEGRLTEVLGPSALNRDVSARLLRYRGDMQAEYESYSPDTKEILEAFTAGINAYIASLNASDGPGVPLEFQLAGFRPSPWNPEDCLNRMAAYSMTGNAWSELLDAQLVSQLGAKQASELLDFDPRVSLDPAPDLDLTGLSPELLKNLVGSDTRIEFPHPGIVGSNNWAVSGALTRSGKPLLANDPHRVIAEPSLRYMVHLKAPGWDVIGAGEPGLPGVALGHNQYIAWGFTIFGLDQHDLYVETLNPADRLQYKTSSGWERMRVEHERFVIRDHDSVQVDLKFTRHGPVLWEDGKRALALRWVGSEPGTAGYLASLALDRARNWTDFEAAMARWKLPSENIVYADTQGNIGEYSTGLAPIRSWTGLLPVPGDGNYEWSGFVPNQALPHSFNPPAGFVATANHKMIPDDYPYAVGYEWASPYRFRRISDVLSQARDRGRKLTVQDMEMLQTDVLSLPALELTNLLRTASGARPSTAAKLLLRWDGMLMRNSPAAALYEVWLKELRTTVLDRAVPQTSRQILRELPTSFVLAQLSNPTTTVFGANPAIERDRVILETLERAASELTKLQGPDPGNWAWGRLHTVRFRHPLDGLDSRAESLFDSGPLSRPGDENTVNATGFSGSFEQVSGASYREILDTSDWDQSRVVNAPGQSGQPLSPHYSDLLSLRDDRRYLPLFYTEQSVHREAVQTLVLEPSQQR